jgi:hypothetical protein
MSLYTPEDVRRWAEVDARCLQLGEQRLSNPPGGRIENALSDNAGWHALAARRLIAEGRLAEARDHLIKGARYCAEIFERHARGEPMNIEYVNAGCFQWLLDALASGDWAAAEHFSSVFPAEFDKRSRSIPSSIYIARPLKALVEGRIEDARQMLAQKQPSIDPMHRGYPECLRAIAARDRAGFVEALKAASVYWRRWAARAERGLPHSVCFLHGAGLMALAQRVMDQRIDEPVDHVPVELIRR